MRDLPRDIRYAIRQLVRTPGFALVAVVTLALGIGANSAIFSLVNTALLRPLPIANPDELVLLEHVITGRTFSLFSYPNYRDIRDRNDVFSDLLAYRFAPLSLSHEGINERLWGYVVTGNYFETLGIKAARGRLLTPEDDRSPGGHPVAVLSYSAWQKRFGGAEDIVGRQILVNGQGYTVVGVAPEGFDGTEIIAYGEVFFPMAMQGEVEVGDRWLERRGREELFVQGRLKPSVSRSQAQSSLQVIASQLAREFPDLNEGKTISVTKAGLMGGMGRGIAIGVSAGVLFVVALVLLLACVNLANLLLARASDRRQEIAVRLALGASRFQIIRQLLTESVLLAIAGGGLGLLLAFWLVRWAATWRAPIDIPMRIDLHIDYRVLIFTFVVSIGTGILFGLLPALQSTRPNIVSGLKDDLTMIGHRRSIFKSALIVFQVALSLLLLIGGGLMLRGLLRAETMELGFNPDNLIKMSFDLRLQGYDDGSGAEFQKALLERVRSMPGVQAAGLASMVPVDIHFGTQRVFIEGAGITRPADAPRAFSNRISGGYFDAMGTRILRGRDFSERDTEESIKVAIINETFARRYWPGQDAIGKRFSFSRPDAPLLQVIGITQNGKYAGVNEDARSIAYRPISQGYTGTVSMMVRAPYDSHKLISDVRRVISQADPHLPISTAKTMSEHMGFALLPARVGAILFGSFGVLALALAAIGLYGVMSFSVSRRTREIGIRMALGAHAADVLRMVLRQGMTLTIMGVGIGLVLAFASTRLMRTLLYGISATDPLTFAAIVSLLIVVALVACFLPARKAAKTSPLVALQCE